jgi:hypothetical protein
MSLYNDGIQMPMRIRVAPSDEGDEESQLYRRAAEGIARANRNRSCLPAFFGAIGIVGVICTIRLFNGFSIESSDFNVIIAMCGFAFFLCNFVADDSGSSRYDPN